MSLINRLINLYSRGRFRDIEFFKKNPGLTQRKVLKRLVRLAGKTEWGREHGFLSIKNPEDFQKKVPITTYDDLYPFIERMMAGERDVLWPGRIKWFAKSAGTTQSRSKFIPVSKSGLKRSHFQGGRDVLFTYLRMKPRSKVLSGKVIAVAGFIDDYWKKRGVEVADISAIMLNRLPFLVRVMIGAGVEKSLIKNWEERIEHIAHIASKYKVTMLAGVPAWISFLLKKFLEIEKKKNVLEIWPHLELLVHGGVSFEPYRSTFAGFFPSPQVNYLEVYNASEGFFAVQDDLSRRDMLLMLDYGIFYEFIPREDLGQPAAKAVTIEGVKKGVDYAVVISTDSGLWRYVIGDTVEFTSLFPHRIKITGRTKFFLNTFGEELGVEQAERAAASAAEEAGASVAEFTAAPLILPGNQGAHEWAIEFDRAPKNKEKFIDALDEALRAGNSDYDNKRYKDLLLKKPIVHFLPKGTFYKWFEGRGKVGGQNKVPRLSADRKYLEEILALVK